MGSVAGVLGGARPHLTVDLLYALQTTGAVRDFADHPVPDEVIHYLIEVARFAPSGGNRQAWKVIVVKDPGVRSRLRELYLAGWREYLAMTAAGLVPWSPLGDREAERAAIDAAGAGGVGGTSASAGGFGGPGGFAEHFDRVPALLVLLADLRGLAAVDRDLGRYTLVGGASVYPFAWSILLAARASGLGGVMTTMVVRHEREALSLLGVPEGWAIAAVLALGYPASGRKPTKLRRRPVSELTAVDRFDGPPLTS
jgi:nitroreductase